MAASMNGVRRSYCGERERVGEAVVQGVKPIEPRAPACSGNRHAQAAPVATSTPGPARPRTPRAASLGGEAHLPRGDVDDRDDQGRTERLRTHTKSAVETDALLCVTREPTNLLDPVLVAGHRWSLRCS